MSLGQQRVCVPTASGWSRIDREIYKVKPRRMPRYSRVSYHQKGTRTAQWRGIFAAVWHSVGAADLAFHNATTRLRSVEDRLHQDHAALVAVAVARVRDGGHRLAHD